MSNLPSLDECFAAVENRRDFYIKLSNGLIIFDYLFRLPDSFDGLRQNLRGITFTESGDLLSLPFHKFYNVGETENLLIEKIGRKKISVYEKIDGSMIHVFLWNNELKCATRGGHEKQQAIIAQEILNNDLDLKYHCFNELDSNRTPIFELVGPSNQHICKYSHDNLIYLASRSKSDGKYKINTIHTPQAKMLGEFNIQDVVDRCKKEKNIEGYVGYFNDEELIKIKTPWYLELHKALNIMKLPLAKKYQIVFSDEIYDIIALLNSIHADASSELKKIFDEAYKKLWAKISELIQAMEKISINKSLPKKEFNSEFARLAKESGFEPISAMFAARDDKDFVPILQQYIIAKLKEKS